MLHLLERAAAALLGSTCSGYTYSKDTDLGEFIMTCQPDDVMDSSGMGCHAPTPCWDSTCSDIFGYTRASCLKRCEYTLSTSSFAPTM